MGKGREVTGYHHCSNCGIIHTAFGSRFRTYCDSCGYRAATPLPVNGKQLMRLLGGIPDPGVTPRQLNLLGRITDPDTGWEFEDPEDRDDLRALYLALKGETDE